MDEETRKRAADLAVQMAHTEMLRQLIGKLLYSPDRSEFQKRIDAFRDGVTDGLKGRPLFPQANEETNAYIQEIAIQHASQAIDSVRPR